MQDAAKSSIRALQLRLKAQFGPQVFNSVLHSLGRGSRGSLPEHRGRRYLVSTFRLAKWLWGVKGSVESMARAKASPCSAAFLTKTGQCSSSLCVCQTLCAAGTPAALLTPSEKLVGFGWLEGTGHRSSTISAQEPIGAKATRRWTWSVMGA